METPARSTRELVSRMQDRPGVRGCGPGRVRDREAGDDVLSHSVSRAVPSARRGLTTVFGMGTGVALAPLPPARAAPAERVDRLVNSGAGSGRSCAWGSARCGVLDNSGDDQAARAISTARLRRSHALHLPPINVLVSNGPSEGLRPGSARLGGGFPLRCFQRFSRPDVATRHCRWRDNRYTSGRSIPVLSY